MAEERQGMSSRLPYMNIRRHTEESYGILGQGNNMSFDVNNLVLQLPRILEEDYTINSNMKRSLIHMSLHIVGTFRKIPGVNMKLYLISDLCLISNPTHIEFHGISNGWGPKFYR